MTNDFIGYRTFDRTNKWMNKQTNQYKRDS